MISNIMIKKDTNSSPVRLLVRSRQLRSQWRCLGGGCRSAVGGGNTSAESPPAQHKSQAKKKLPSNRSSLEDFITGYKAAYALIYEHGDYERAMTALRPLDHDGNADVAN